MKQSFLLISFVLLSAITSRSQSSDLEKLENQKYYQTFIKDNITNMREYVDSSNIKIMLTQMEQINDKIGVVLDKIEIPLNVDDTISVDENISMDDIETPEEDITLGENTENPERIEDIFVPTEDEDGTPLDKFIPGRKNSVKRTKSNFIINYGLNFLGSNTGSSAVTPEAKTWSSWFWEYGVQYRTRLGGQSSKFYLLSGISYLKNRFTWDNDVKLSSENDTPSWNNELNLKESPKMRVGYITIPLGFRLRIAKKTFLDLGGYVGYRVLTSQTHERKIGDEKITEKRNGDYELNDWAYGATAGLKIMSTRIVFKYNLSKLFKDNPNYNTQLLMVGFQSAI